MTEAILIPDGETFVPTPLARSPWGDTLVHGGPPAGLLARAIVGFDSDPEMQLSRLTVDLFRQAPMKPLTVTARTLRLGRRIHVVEASLFAEGVEVSRATGLLLRRAAVAGLVQTEHEPLPHPDTIPSGPLGLGPSGATSGGPRRDGFHTTAEFRRIPRRTEGDPPASWIRLPVPFIAGEETAPLTRVAALCDFVNAVGGGGRSAPVGFINVDCTVFLHREPEGEWIGLRVEREVSPDGRGLSAATIYDTIGPVGRAIQTVLANEMR